VKKTSDVMNEDEGDDHVKEASYKMDHSRNNVEEVREVCVWEEEGEHEEQMWVDNYLLRKKCHTLQALQPMAVSFVQFVADSFFTCCCHTSSFRPTLHTATAVNDFLIFTAQLSREDVSLFLFLFLFRYGRSSFLRIG
jgi:hypothetical protein